MIKKFLEDFYEGKTFSDIRLFVEGVNGAIEDLNWTKEDVTKKNGMKNLRIALGEKYREDIKNEINKIENNLSEDNEWDLIYMMNLYEFYTVI